MSIFKKSILAVLLVGAVGFGAWAAKSKVVGQSSPSPIAANATQSPSKVYVALGDSVAAGMGLEGAADTSACGRTNESYPHVVAQSMGITLKSYACIGATLQGSVLGKQTVNKLALDSQIQKLKDAGTVDYISVTIGANDLAWTEVLSKCYTGECGGADDNAAIDAKLQNLDQQYGKLLDELKALHLSGQKVVVTGYFQGFTEKATCADTSGLSSAEIQWMRSKIEALNKVITVKSQSYPFVSVILPDFTEHELCSSDSWVQGFNSIAPYHPTASGQKEISQKVINAFKQ